MKTASVSIRCRRFEPARLRGLHAEETSVCGADGSAEAPAPPPYQLPPVSLLKLPHNPRSEDVSEELKQNASKLVETLKSFGVQTRIVDITRGPTVTRYELQPSTGVKISKITGLADDIALNLATAGVRIEAPIPNKPAVGIEVPNRVTDTVTIREVIDSDEFFFWMADHAAAIAAREAEAVSEAIARCVVFKADVVAMDKTESKGVRECLNYGHTLGHAVEKLAGYGTFTHGVGVAEGMRFAARMAIDLVGAAPEFVEAQDELLDALGLPPLAWSAEPEALLDAMKRDKKARGGHVRFVLPRDVGEWELVEVDDATILSHLRTWVEGK